MLTNVDTIRPDGRERPIPPLALRDERATAFAARRVTAAIRGVGPRLATWRDARFLRFVALALVAAPVAAAPTLAEIEAAAPAAAAAWREVAPDDLLLLDTPRGTLTVELAPFAPEHVAAVRALIRAGAFAGGAVTRVQDNYVVQWGTRAAVADAAPPAAASPRAELPAEYDWPAAGVPFTPLPFRDAYAAQAGFSDGWPVASDGHTMWLVHCYGMVGVGRDNPPSTGDGSELYAVIGHAPRHLDRNMAVVGRALDGLAALAALPRGTETLGFYRTASERLPITGAHLASDTPGAPRWQVMRTEGATFAALIAARADRREPFFVRPAGGVDVCNVKVPARRISPP